MKICTGSFDDPTDPRRFKHYSFGSIEEDPEIPVVLVFPTSCVEHPRTKDCVPRVLMMKRGFEVGAMKGKWSPIAGVDDHLDQEGGDNLIGSQLTAMNELWAEAGLKAQVPDVPGHFNLFAENRYADPNWSGRTWVQRLFHVSVGQLEVTLNWENYGYAWISIQAISDYLKTGEVKDPYLQAFIDEGNVVEEQGNLHRFIVYCRNNLSYHIPIN